MLHNQDRWRHLIVWEFLVRSGSETQFETIYGSNGDWVQLFSKAEGFIETELNHDLNNPRRYLTFDYWSSKAAYESFREKCRAEYTAIDQRCEGLTERETEIGRFERVASQAGRNLRTK